jgi:DNA replication protein DnaC
VLAIDEMGKGQNTPFETAIVDELVSRRYNAAATTLATTNYPPGQRTGRAVPNLASPSDTPTLSDRVGPRVFSRLKEVCDFVPVLGDDYRLRRRRSPNR